MFCQLSWCNLWILRPAKPLSLNERAARLGIELPADGDARRVRRIALAKA